MQQRDKGKVINNKKKILKWTKVNINERKIELKK